jgi:lysophospholipase L1-like esterase
VSAYPSAPILCISAAIVAACACSCSHDSHAAAAAADVSGRTTPIRVVVVAFGDSTTAPRGKVRVFAQRLEETVGRNDHRVRVINSGVPRDTTRAARERLARDVIAHHPRFATISFGINDSAVDVFNGATQPRVPLREYEQNLAWMVSRLREQDIRPILMTPNPVAWTDELKKLYGKPPYRPDDADGWNVLLKEYAQAVRRVAESNDVPLVDTYRLFQAYAAEPGHALNDLMSDGMHPNDAGHDIIADQVALLLASAGDK